MRTQERNNVLYHRENHVDERAEAQESTEREARAQAAGENRDPVKESQCLGVKPTIAPNVNVTASIAIRVHHRA
eukprot:1003642-Prymnesium_polylepis.2